MDKRKKEALSSTALNALVAAGLLLPLLKPGTRQKVRILRTLETIALSRLALVALKHTIPARRPDSLQQDSFPSSHTLHAMGVATVASAFARKQSPVWYGGVLVVGVSRLLLRRHRLRDVIAGAGIGYGIARLELRKRRGFLLPVLSKRLNDSLSKRK